MSSSSPLPRSHPAFILATWFWSGLLPKAPGTWGSLAALPFAYAIQYYGGPWALAGASALVFAVGCWATARYTAGMQNHDPGQVVIDEVAGQWMTLIPAGLDPVLYLAGFVLFRLFDITKPWPIGPVDRHVKGALGVMLDDILAAVYSLIGLLAVAYFVGGV